MTDPEYNVNAAIAAEKVAERLYYPDRLARLREIEENEMDGDRFTPAEFWQPPVKAVPKPIQCAWHKTVTHATREEAFQCERDIIAAWKERVANANA